MNYPRTGKIVALYSVFNSKALLAESMRSMLPVVDEYRVYDGRYLGFEYKQGNCPCGDNGVHDNSCDGTITQVELFGVTHPSHKVTLRKMPTMFEFKKRQQMFDDLDVGDVAIVIDDDEYFYGDAREIKGFAGVSDDPELNNHYIPYRLGDTRIQDLRHSLEMGFRVHVKTPGLRFQLHEKYLNYGFMDDEGIIAIGEPDMVTFRDARMIELVGDGTHLGYRELDRDAASLNYDERAIAGLIPRA